MPGRQHKPQLRRRPQQQQLQLPQRLRRTQLMHIINHQPEPLLQSRQVLQQPLHDRPPVQIRRRRQLPHQPRPLGRLPQRAQHRQPEPLRITLAMCHRHPRGALREIRLADPGPQQDGLAAPRRRRHHRHPRRLEPPQQPRTGNDTSRTRASGPAGNGLRSLARPHGTSSHDTNQPRRCSSGICPGLLASGRIAPPSGTSAGEGRPGELSRMNRTQYPGSFRK